MAARVATRAIVRMSAFAVRRRRASVRGIRDSRVRRYVVYTFVNDEAEYERCVESFRAAGFTESRTRFVRLHDRRAPGGSDPYELIRRLGEGGRVEHAILVHQDVRLDQGAGIAHLDRELERLDDVDPGWVVAGDAGMTPEFRRVRRLRDPHGGSTPGEVPASVASLDENLLIFNPLHPPSVSDGLEGFHLYGTDVALNARLRGGGAHVVDFPVTHLSAGKLDETYSAVRQAFVETWKSRIGPALVPTLNEPIAVVRPEAVRRLLDGPTVHGWIKAWGPRHG
jgi:hypothetical protein